MPKIKILKTKDELYRLKQDWSVLHSKSKSNSIFSTWEWISNYEKILMNSNEELNIICIFNEREKLIAVAPFLIKKERKYGLEYNIIELIGSDERIAADYMDMIIDPECLNEGKRLLMDSLIGGVDFKWDGIRWNGILNDSKCWDLLREFKNKGYEVVEEPMDICPYITLPKTWEEYLGTLSKKSRYCCRRRFFGKSHGVDMSASSEKNDDEGNKRFLYLVRILEISKRSSKRILSKRVACPWSSGNRRLSGGISIWF
jgi:hypothetical protein